jgi:hypothetical protein
VASTTWTAGPSEDIALIQHRLLLLGVGRTAPGAAVGAEVTAELSRTGRIYVKRTAIFVLSAESTGRGRRGSS